MLSFMAANTTRFLHLVARRGLRTRFHTLVSRPEDLASFVGPRFRRLALLLHLLLLSRLNRRLLLPHDVVLSSERQQLLMSAALNDFALVQNNNLVRIGNGRKAMSGKEKILAPVLAK